MTSSCTVRFESSCGPKLKADANRSASNGRSAGHASTAASHKYPLRGSSTCCHGRVAVLLRTPIARDADKARMQSGTMRSSAQSPPPITLPALALAIRTGCPERNDRRQEEIAISAAALLELYGSYPPSGSSS